MRNCAHRIPYLQLDWFAVDLHHASSELNPYGEIVHVLEALIGELEQ